MIIQKLLERLHLVVLFWLLVFFASQLRWVDGGEGEIALSWINRAVDEVGAGRIALGSWWPEHDPEAAISQIRGLGLDHVDEDMILSGTAR